MRFCPSPFGRGERTAALLAGYARMRQISPRFPSATATIAAALILSPMAMPMAAAQVVDPAAAPPILVPSAAPPLLQTPPATPATGGEPSPAVVITPPQPVVQSLPEPAPQQAQEDAAPARRASPDRREGRAVSDAASRSSVPKAQLRVEDEKTRPSVAAAPVTPAPASAVPQESVVPPLAETSAPTPATDSLPDDTHDTNANLWLGGGAALLLLGGAAYFLFSRRRRSEEEAYFTDEEFGREDRQVAPAGGRLRAEILSRPEAPLELGAFSSRTEPSDGPEKQGSPASVQSHPNRTEVSPPVVGEGDAPSPENPFLTRRSRRRRGAFLATQSYSTTARLDDRPPLRVRDPRPGLNGEADRPLQLRYSFGRDEQPEPPWEPRFGRS